MAKHLPARQSINGVERSWPAHVLALWADVVERLDWADDEWVSSANYFTPRPYVDDYNRGSNKAGFVYTLQPGARVCFREWHQTFTATPTEERYR